MKSILVDTLEDRFVVSIDKKMINKDQLLQFVDNLRIEFMANQANFEADIEIVGEELKQGWWDKNKERLINPTSVD